MVVGCHVISCVCHQDWKGEGPWNLRPSKLDVVYQSFNVHRIFFFYLKDVILLSQYVHE